MKTQLILVRHGQSEANLYNQFAGQHDFALTDLGREQAQRTADYLKDTHIDVIYSSDLSRAMETAAPIAASHGLAIIPDPDLRELFFGELEGVNVEEFTKLDPDFVRDWKQDFSHMRPRGGESVAELYARAQAVLDKIARQNVGKTVCIATHGAMLRAMACVWGGGGLDSIADVPWASNASVSYVTWEDGAYTVQEYSHDAHIAEIRTQVGDPPPSNCK